METVQGSHEQGYSCERVGNALLDSLKARHRQAGTVRAYDLGLRRFRAFLEVRGLADLRDVTRAHVREYQDELMRGTLTAGTVRGRLRAVRSLYDFMAPGSPPAANPAAAIPMPRSPGSLPRNALTQARVRRLLEAPSLDHPAGVRDKAILEVLYSTGMRLAELCRLAVADVDLAHGYVRVNQGKGGKDRMLPLGRIACRSLSAYLRGVRGGLLRHDRLEQALFLGRRGRRMSPRWIELLVHRYARVAGIEARRVRTGKSVTPHVLRHSCATHMLAAGANVVHVQRLLGHASLGTTQVYTRVTVRDVRRMHARCHPRERGAA